MSALAIAEYERKIAEQQGRIEYIMKLAEYWMDQFDAERERAQRAERQVALLRDELSRTESIEVAARWARERDVAEAKVDLYMRRVESAEKANDALAADARRLEEERNTAVATLAMVRMTLARTVDNLATAVA